LNNQTVGISNELGNWDRDFKIFPNPASESVIIRQYGQLQLLDAEIYDPNSRKVKEFQLNQIDNEINLSELSSGIYYVRISFKGQYLSTEKVLLK